MVSGEFIAEWREMQAVTTRWLLTQCKEFYQHRIEKLVPLGNKYLKRTADYLKKWRYSSATESQVFFLEVKMESKMCVT